MVNQPISRSAPARGYTGSQHASDEIHAYIAARDMALVEAEGRPSNMTLNRAFLANQLVESSLKPARAPYQAQCLPEAEAARERQRCESADARIAQLRTAAPSQQYAVAA